MGGGRGWREREEPLGYRQIESEDLHRCGSGQPDWHLYGAPAQFRAQPSSRDDRPRSGSGRGPGGSVAVYAVGPDGSGYAVPALLALKRIAPAFGSSLPSPSFPSAKTPI